jgi:hypothetical protein
MINLEELKKIYTEQELRKILEKLLPYFMEKELVNDGDKMVLKGSIVVDKKARRQGEVNCFLPQAQGKSGARYTSRLKLTPAKPLKEKICK